VCRGLRKAANSSASAAGYAFNSGHRVRTRKLAQAGQAPRFGLEAALGEPHDWVRRFGPTGSGNFAVHPFCWTVWRLAASSGPLHHRVLRSIARTSSRGCCPRRKRDESGLASSSSSGVGCRHGPGSASGSLLAASALLSCCAAALRRSFACSGRQRQFAPTPTLTVVRTPAGLVARGVVRGG
jgi:hypothetical protein